MFRGFWLGVFLALLASFLFLSSERTIKQADLGTPFDYTNLQEPVIAPRLVGFPLKLMSWVVVVPWFGEALNRALFNSNKFYEVRALAAALPAVAPQWQPLVPPTENQLAQHTKYAEMLEQDYATILGTARARTNDNHDSVEFRYTTIADYHSAFLTQQTTPTAVAKQILNLLKRNDSCSPANAMAEVHEEFVLKQAAESEQRYKNGRPLGPLDGIPVAVKEQMHLKGHTLQMGTIFMGASTPTQVDSAPVHHLREAGVVFIGLTHMHEFGLGVTGNNPARGTPLNPHGCSSPLHHRYSGGSSSGSAVAVSAGLVPFAVSADGGGSIRVPASATGVVGLKPTFSRIPDSMHHPSIVWTVTHTGPIGATVDDVALAYVAMAKPVPAHNEEVKVTFVPSNIVPPPAHLHGLADAGLGKQRPLANLRVGVLTHKSPLVSTSVNGAVDSAAQALVDLGATLTNVELPNMETLFKAHTITILGEMGASSDAFWDQHKFKLNPETRISLALGRTISAKDYISAQKLRAYLMSLLRDLFDKVDVILLPAMSFAAPRFHSDAHSTGESNLALMKGIMQFMAIANLSGVPALVLPWGAEVDQGKTVPLAVQFLASHWEETLLLRVAKVLELSGHTNAKRVKPDGFVQVSVDKSA